MSLLGWSSTALVGRYARVTRQSTATLPTGSTVCSWPGMAKRRVSYAKEPKGNRWRGRRRRGGHAHELQFPPTGPRSIADIRTEPRDALPIYDLTSSHNHDGRPIPRCGPWW